MRLTRDARSLLVAAAFAVITLWASNAIAAPADATTLKRSVSDSLNTAIDGTDIYWTKHILRRTSEAALMRGSFLDRKKTRLATFSFPGGFDPQVLLAGGGHAFVSLVSDGIDNDFETGETSKIVRISRNGARAVVAAGSNAANEEESVVVEKGIGRMNDCGKQVSLMSVSSTGSAVIAEVTADRDSTACGKKKNVNHTRIYELPLSGIPREIYRYDVEVKSRIKVFDGDGWESRGGKSLGPGVDSAEVFGDRAVFMFGRSGGLFIRELTSGALSGPYFLGLSAKRGFASGTLDPTGQLAINRATILPGKIFDVDKTASGIYKTPGDASTFTKVSSSKSIVFCGRHLIVFSKRSAVELDPTTLLPVRTVSSDGTSATGPELRCTDSYLYGVRSDGPDRSTYIARSLD